MSVHPLCTAWPSRSPSSCATVPGVIAPSPCRCNCPFTSMVWQALRSSPRGRARCAGCPRALAPRPSQRDPRHTSLVFFISPWPRRCTSDSRSAPCGPDSVSFLVQMFPLSVNGTASRVTFTRICPGGCSSDSAIALSACGRAVICSRCPGARVFVTAESARPATADYRPVEDFAKTYPGLTWDS